MAGHSEFQSASKRIAVNRHHYRLRAVFNVKEKRQQASTGRGPGGHLAEFLDVSAGYKRSAATDYNHCLDGTIAIHLIDRRPDSLRHTRTESVHRRVVDGNNCYVVIF